MFRAYNAHHQEPVKLPLPPLVSVWMWSWEVEVFSAVVGLLVGRQCLPTNKPTSVSPLTNRPRLRTRPPPHSYGNQRLQRQFDRLLMMGIIMPETSWAVSVRQSNKILRLIVASSWVFYLNYLSSKYFSVYFVLSRPFKRRYSLYKLGKISDSYDVKTRRKKKKEFAVCGWEKFCMNACLGLTL